MGRDDDYSDSDEEGYQRKKKSKRRERDDNGADYEDRRRKKSKKHDKKKRKRDYRSNNDDDDTDPSEDSRRRHKKHHKKKKHKKEMKRSRSGDPSSFSPDPLERNHSFADALYSLLEEYPALSTDLPIMFIRMAGGTSFDLSQMSDAGAASGLERVFKTLSDFGIDCSGQSWTWKPPDGGGGQENDLVLVKIARTLLDQIGFTIEAVENHGKQQPDPPQGSKDGEKDEPPFHSMSEYTPLQKQAFDLLGRFLRKDNTLANQLGELCHMILNGESVAIDGLPDENLRNGLEQLLRGAGLEKSEIEDDGDDEPTSMGYGLPEINDHFARANMESILKACKLRAANSEDAQPPTRRAIRGPLPEHMADAYPKHNHDDNEDDEGPVPVGEARARAAESTELVAAMAERRKQEMEGLVSDQVQVAKPGEREEWMIDPGEHDLLQGIKSGTIRNRNFENKKVKSAAAVEVPTGPIDPTMQAEVDAIIQAHKEARGPSLMEQHRLNKAAEQAAKGTEKSQGFSWSRDKDLDAGRRVDKEALRMIMGGAGGELRDKFQGGFTKT
jgi:hypothetical protein